MIFAGGGNMKKVFALMIFCFLTCVSAAEIAADAFFKILQDSTSKNGSTYGILEGLATHIRRENGRKKIEEYPCFMGVIITPGKSITQIILDNKEGYLVGRVQKESTYVRPFGKKGTVMQRIGVSPRDLSMSFLDGKLIRELESETLRAVSCRVFLIRTENPREWVKIYAAEDYFFVLKAEFFSSEPGPKSVPVRTLNVNSFAKKNDLYYTHSVEIYGPGWRTDIVFDKADVNLYNADKPKQVFRSMK